jgi:hypothetical protein
MHERYIFIHFTAHGRYYATQITSSGYTVDPCVDTATQHTRNLAVLVRFGARSRNLMKAVKKPDEGY